MEDVEEAVEGVDKIALCIVELYDEASFDVICNTVDVFRLQVADLPRGADYSLDTSVLQDKELFNSEDTFMLQAEGDNKATD